MGYDADGKKNASNRIFHDWLSCKQGEQEKDPAVACYNVTYIVHTMKYTLFTFVIVFCDVIEIINTMRKWNTSGAYNMNAVVLKQHRELLNNYMGRFLYRLLMAHWGVRAFVTCQEGFLFAFGEFNERYCEGAEREETLCYAWNQENKRRRLGWESLRVSRKLT